MLPQAFMEEIATLLEQEQPKKERLALEKKRLAKQFGVGHVPSDIELLTNLPKEEVERYKSLLLSKPVRSASGVVVVAIMTKPSRCPHGKCTYCPGGIGSVFGDVPQSYTGNEPASMRGARAEYDAYLQVFNRLEQYVVSGHDPQKTEIIVMGGTFPNEPVAYQESFVRDAFRALNDFSTLFFSSGTLDISSFKEFFLLPGSVLDKKRTAKVNERVLAEKRRHDLSLEDVQRENEEAYVRCVGLTVETRPTHGRLEHGNQLLKMGCTRIELGVQTTFDDVLHAVHRDHTVADSKDSIATLRDLGFKLNFHIMLGLPGMTHDRDMEAVRNIFADPGFRPDMIKLYPCMVMPGTPLQRQYERGEFKPLQTAEAAELISDMIPLVPRWCRIMRVQRDIPTKVTEAGVDKTNLRQLVEERMAAKGVSSLDIRAREIRQREITKAVLNVQHYESSNGEEYFISIDDPKQDALIGYCRLRFPARQLRPEFDVRTAMVRELHVLGKATPLGVIGIRGSAQHRGFGYQLMQVAERIAKENGKRKLLVISGVGVRRYYEKLGYKRDGPYMAKVLA